MPGGGLLSQGLSASKDIYNKLFRGAEFGHSDWFALWRDDMSIDDWTWVNSVKRGNFRLHLHDFGRLYNAREILTLR